MQYWFTALLLLASVATAQAKENKPNPPEAEAPETKAPEVKKPKVVTLAIIVHEKNPIKKVSYSELRSLLKMRRQFWPNRKRCDLYLPNHRSDSYKLLLQVIYKSSHKKLQKYWVRKLFSGDIPSKPSYVTSPKAAGAHVRKNEGALSIVPHDKVPKGVRVLLIDGKKPGDAGYALSGTLK